MNNSGSFSIANLYAHKNIEAIKLGSFVLVVDHRLNPHHGILLSTSTRTLMGVERDCFFIKSAATGYTESYDVHDVDIYEVTAKSDMSITFDELNTF